jgi:hypothetical protein
MAESNVAFSDKAITILQKTQDGDLLSPTHLELLEIAVNGFLNEKGKEMFESLYEQVISGEYRQPNLHGVEYMTQDHDDNILFKGQTVENYASPWVYSLDAKNSLLKLQRECLFLESKGITPSISNCAWDWKFDKEYGEHEKTTLDNLLAGNNGKIVFAEITADNNNCQIVTFFMPGHPNEAAITATNDYHDFIKRNGNNDDRGFYIRSEVFSYGDGPVREATEDELKSILCCFAFLKGENLIQSEAINEYGSKEHNRYYENLTDFSQEQEDENDEEI